jgi:lysophospholipase L1-like esterase
MSDRYFRFHALRRQVRDVFLAFCLTSILAEGSLQVIEFLRTKREEPRSYYSFQLTANDGTPLSHRKGRLKLIPHPALVYRHAPNQHDPCFSINSTGLRGGEIAAKRDGMIRVIGIGGSTAFGTGLPSDDDTWTSQLQKRSVNLEVLNAGVIGYLSGQELSYLVTALVELSPDVVIALDGWNDFSTAPSVLPYSYGYGGFDQVEQQLEVAYRLTSNNYPQRIMANLINGFFPAIGASIRRLSAERPRPSGSHLYQVASTYAMNHRKMALVGEAFGFSFLTVIQPEARVLFPDKLAPDPSDSYKRFCEAAKKLLSENGIPVLDLNDSPSMFSLEMFKDAIHLDPSGNRAIAEVIGRELDRRPELVKAHGPLQKLAKADDR